MIPTIVMIKPTINKISTKLYTAVSYAMRTPITNKIKPETNFNVFPTFSPLSLLITLYLTNNILSTTPLINLMEKIGKYSAKKNICNTFLKNSNINIIKNTIIVTGENMKKMKTLINENSGQGAAEYILLFGGVIVIALLALTIYRSYMETSDRSLKAKDDIIDVRNTILDNRTHV